MVADREPKGDISPSQGSRHIFIKGLPHGSNLFWSQRRRLPRHHITPTEDEVWLPAGNQFNAFDHFWVVGSGAVATIEVANHHDPHIFFYWGKYAGGSRVVNPRT